MHIAHSLSLLSLLLTTIISCTTHPPFTSHAHSRLPRRDITTVLTDISSLSSLVNSLTTTATSYTGSLTQTLGLASVVKELKSALAVATADVRAEKAFEGDESESVVSAAGELVVDIRALLGALSEKAPVIASAGYTTLVSDQLKTLQPSTDELVVALGEKVVADEVEKGMRGSIKEIFENALAAFSGTVVNQHVRDLGLDYIESSLSTYLDSETSQVGVQKGFLSV
ncbi:hydrophobic surface binding protein A-domain-containing protein [Cadophora sp. MPI-SDFR-AT-0126]|nr:hydrophobic surface binding protein A-domain-containing protein [Leotiomycetes sp. MPI-SDFR-AT-0126]